MTKKNHERNPTARFTSRVANYVRFRPGYPAEILPFLRETLGIPAGATVADIGSGTGIFAKLLLEAGYFVMGIEPNAQMREAGESFLRDFSRFRSMPGRAEQTGLASHSMDLITAAQAYHWFETKTAREEFLRILKPGGLCVLVWNERKVDHSDFAREYEALIERFSTDYKDVNHANLAEEGIRDFLGTNNGLRRFENSQQLDLEGFIGRLASSSYAPAEDDPRYPAMTEAMESLFDRYQTRGRIQLDYETKLFWGDLR